MIEKNLIKQKEHTGNSNISYAKVAPASAVRSADFTWGLASNLSEGIIGKYGGTALGGLSEFKNFSIQLYQKAYFQMFNDVSKSGK